MKYDKEEKANQRYLKFLSSLFSSKQINEKSV